MRLSFNTTGPCDPERHYMLPPEERLPDLLNYVDEQLYFVVHAARQTGKSTAMIGFAKELRAAGKLAVYCSFENARVFDDVASSEAIWLEALVEAGRADLDPADRVPDEAPGVPKGARLHAALSNWARVVAPRPLILLFDEVDVLATPPLVNLLGQLRAGFATRGPGRFPTSVALIGMRDLKDYLTLAKDGVATNPGSPFNVKKASLTLRNFTHAEVSRLYAQHTAATGQEFTPEAVERVFYWTQGQPFLVNALAYQCVGRARQYEDPRIEGTVTAEHIEEAKEKLILSRTTHLDSLAYKLKEERVAPIIRALLTGDEDVAQDSDDFQYVVDLGLIRRDRDGIVIANPLYREVLARQLTVNTQGNVGPLWWRWSTPEGHLDMPALMREFQVWWRENADALKTRAPTGYTEATAHIAFMGFLQRVVNGGGRVYREYGAGRGRIDILVEYGGRRDAIELKRIRTKDGPDAVRAKGITQLSQYLDQLGLTEGWLVLFDQRKRRSWDERIWTEDVEANGKTLHVIGA